MTSVPLSHGKRHIVLVGLMGAGKTSVGRLIAKRLKMTFTDADTEIEKAAGLTVPEIFRVHGEKIFRDGERRIIARLLEAPPGVLATGGGAYMDIETRALIRQRGVSIWLRAEVQTLYERTRRRVGRPLLDNDDPMGTLERLAHIRYPVYAEADVTIDTGREKPRETVQRIIEELNKMAAQSSPVGNDA
jgi:shikimate kinase